MARTPAQFASHQPDRPDHPAKANTSKSLQNAQNQGVSGFFTGDEIVLLIIVAGDECVLVAALGVNVLLGDKEGRLHEGAWRLVVEGAVQFIDRLPGLEFDLLRDRHDLILVAFADAIITPNGFRRPRSTLPARDRLRPSVGWGRQNLNRCRRQRLHNRQAETLYPVHRELRLAGLLRKRAN